MVLFEEETIAWNASVITTMLWAIFPISIGSVSLLFNMIHKVVATKITSLLYLTPPTTVIMAWLLFNEPLTWMAAAGIVLAMGAVVLVNEKAPQ